MTQGVLPFKYEESKKSRSLTNFSGLLPYVELLYQMDFFQQEGCQRFGRIEFAISCDVSESFKRSVSEIEEGDWKTIHRHIGNGLKIKTNQQWAESPYVSRIESPDYRYIVIRERV